MREDARQLLTAMWILIAAPGFAASMLVVIHNLRRYGPIVKANPDLKASYQQRLGRFGALATLLFLVTLIGVLGSIPAPSPPIVSILSLLAFFGLDVLLSGWAMAEAWLQGFRPLR